MIMFDILNPVISIGLFGSIYDFFVNFLKWGFVLGV